MYKFGDRVRVTSSKYSCASVGTVGEIVDNDGYYDSIVKDIRYLVRWDDNPTMLWGVYSADIEQVLA